MCAGLDLSPIAQNDGTSTEYLYGDLLGSTLLVADATGTVTCVYAYNEYGTITGHTGTTTTAIGYTGNWTDTATGLLYLRARDYDPHDRAIPPRRPARSANTATVCVRRQQPTPTQRPSGLCIGMDDTPQDRPCTANDFFREAESQAQKWSKIGADIGNNFASMAFGMGDALTFNPGLWVFGASSWSELWRNAWIDDCVVPENGFYHFGGLWAGVATGGRSGGGAVTATRGAAQSQYLNITNASAVRNIGTNVAHQEFIKNLITSGWVHSVSKDGVAHLLKKGGATYSVRPHASSYDGWPARYKPAGVKTETLKIRLEYPN